jgi:glycosyltransferase involved in cell wall biosynthesis
MNNNKKQSKPARGATKHVRILGTRGVPAAHGGFETFAEHLALYLIERGWRVTVYCQEEGGGPLREDEWCGVRRVCIPVALPGAAGTIMFDWRSAVHAVGEPGLVLTLGYNTAVFSALYRLKAVPNVMNMDGIEWRRKKWGLLAKAWFWLNEIAGCWLVDTLVADHPSIKDHLATRVSRNKIAMIPYGGARIESADPGLIASFGLTPGGYAMLVARPEPENSILEIVRAWSRAARGYKLVILGNYEAGVPYHHAVMAAASPEVLFPGAVYSHPLLESLRFHARLYVHGHTVGGTSPTLVEALGAGNPVLALDNSYNRWVAGPEAAYFADESSCSELLEQLLPNADRLARMRQASRARHAEVFTWNSILKQYEMLFERMQR